jgi:hypothetical protein
MTVKSLTRKINKMLSHKFIGQYGKFKTVSTNGFMFIGETITGKFIYFNYAGGYHITN